MVNIISVERKQSPYKDFAHKVTNYLHDLLEKEEDINYILYKPGQSIDKYVVEQIPLLREKYPGSQIKVVQYRNIKDPENTLGYPAEIIDDFQLFPAKEYLRSDGRTNEDDTNNFIEFALEKANIVFAMSKQEFLFSTSFLSYRYGHRFHYKVVPVADDTLSKKDESLYAALPDLERCFIDDVCDQQKTERSLSVFFYNDIFRDQVLYSLLLQKAGFSLYSLQEKRTEAAPKRVLLLQSDHFCNKFLGDILHKQLETLFKKEKAIDFIFGPCMAGMAEEAAKMIDSLRESYPKCRIRLVRVLDPRDLSRYFPASGLRLIDSDQGEKALLQKISKGVEELTAPIPAGLMYSVALCSRPTSYSWSIARFPFDAGYMKIIDHLLKKTDLALVYRYTNAADHLCRLLRSRTKKKDAEVVTLYDPKVFAAIDECIDQFNPKNQEIYRKFCAGVPVKDLAESLGWYYQKVYTHTNGLLDLIEKQIADVSKK